MNGYGYLILGIVLLAIMALLSSNKKCVKTPKNI